MSGRRADQGSVMRPGAAIVPSCVWHELQSPLVAGVVISRVRPM
jgi:hypothetical protein